MVGCIAEPIVKVIDLQESVRTTAEQHEQEICGNDHDDKTCLPISPEDIHVFIVSATDGLMDYHTPEEVVETMAAGFFDDELHPLTMADSLIPNAANQWNYESANQYRDDIAIAATNLGNQFSKLSKDDLSRTEDSDEEL